MYIGAEKIILRCLKSAAVVLSLVIGSGAARIENSVAGILNSLLIPSSIATTYSSFPFSLHATL